MRPEDVGLVAGSRRRVAGLRREELALLAGISADYYLRLEQGRDKNPSAQVLDALARALRLDVKATEYLHQLASSATLRRSYGAVEAPADGTQELIDQFSMPAIVASRCLDVLAANAGARALSPGFAPGQNFLRWRLLEPAARELYADWDEATDVAVSGLGEAAGSDPDDPPLRSLIEDVSRPCARSLVLVAAANSTAPRTSSDQWRRRDGKRAMNHIVALGGIESDAKGVPANPRIKRTPTAACEEEFSPP